MKYKVPYKKLKANAIAPFRVHVGDEGFDLYASEVEYKHGFQVVSCGLGFDLSEVGGAIVAARSSLWKRDMVFSNGIGVIDRNYRGEVKGIFKMDECSTPYEVGERFMQIIFNRLAPNDEVEFVEVNDLQESDRGSGGFGSTGR